MIMKPKKDIYEQATDLIPEEDLTPQSSLEENTNLEEKQASLLDLYKQQIQKSDQDIEQAKTLDEVSSLVNTIAPALSGRSRARAIVSAGSLGADIGPNKVNLPTNRIEDVRSLSKDRLQALLDQYKLTNQLQGKKAEPKVMKVGDRVIQVSPTGEAKELYKPSLTQEELEDRGLNRTQKQLQIQQLEKQLNKKPGDDLTPEQQESAKLDLDIKKANLEKAQKSLIEDPEKTFMEKQRGLLEIQKMLSDIKKTDAQVDQMSAPKQLSELDLANIEKAKAQAKMYESKVNPATNPLLEKKMQTEELRQQDLKRKQAESKAQIQGNLDKIDEQINDLLKADAGLKKGGVTGLVDNTLGKWWDMARGNEDQMTRQLLNKIETQITLMGSGSLKGAISDKEIDLLKQEVPSKFGDEKNWRSWIKPRIELLQKARKNVASQLAGQQSESSPVQAAPSRVEESPNNASNDLKRSMYTLGDIVERNGKKYKWNPIKGKYQLI